jgi:hypothetical protein
MSNTRNLIPTVNYDYRKVQGHYKEWYVLGDWHNLTQLAHKPECKHLSRTGIRHRLEQNKDLFFVREVLERKRRRKKHPETMVFSSEFKCFSTAAALFCQSPRIV